MAIIVPRRPLLSRGLVGRSICIRRIVHGRRFTSTCTHKLQPVLELFSFQEIRRLYLASGYGASVQRIDRCPEKRLIMYARSIIYTIGCNRSGGTLSLERGSAFSSYVMSSRMRVHIDSKHMHADVRARMQALRYTA